MSAHGYLGGEFFEKRSNGTGADRLPDVLLMETFMFPHTLLHSATRSPH